MLKTDKERIKFNLKDRFILWNSKIDNENIVLFEAFLLIDEEGIFEFC